MNKFSILFLCSMFIMMGTNKIAAMDGQEDLSSDEVSLSDDLEESSPDEKAETEKRENDYIDICREKLFSDRHFALGLTVLMAASIEARKQAKFSVPHTHFDRETIENGLESFEQFYEKDEKLTTLFNQSLDRLSVEERQHLFYLLDSIRLNVGDDSFEYDKDDKSFKALFRLFESAIVKRISKPVWYHHIIYANALTKFSLAGFGAALSYIAYEKCSKRKDTLTTHAERDLSAHRVPTNNLLLSNS